MLRKISICIVLLSSQLVSAQESAPEAVIEQTTSEAEEPTLLRILSEWEGGVDYDLNLMLDEQGDIEGFAIEDHAQRIEFDAQDVVNGYVVLVRNGRFEVVRLSCRECSFATGGVLKIDYLQHALRVIPKRRRMTVNILLHRDADGWYLTPWGEDREINLVRVDPNTIAGTPVGIKRLRFEYGEEELFAEEAADQP